MRGIRVWARLSTLAAMAPGDETASRSGVAEAYDRHVGRYGAQLAAGLIDIAAVRAGSGCWTSAADPDR